MGTDIHFYVEKRDALGQWQSADEWEPNPYYDPNDPDEGGSMHVPWEKSYYSGRNYELFAILANVRNGKGFAGIKINGGLNPIAMPRGLPEDVSALVRDECAYGHDESWLNLKELLDYDWTQKVMMCGYVDMPTFSRWDDSRKTEGPEEYSGDVDGSRVTKLDNEAMRQKIAELTGEYVKHWDKFEVLKQAQSDLEMSYYTFVEWGESYHQATAHFWSSVMPRLLHLADGDYDSVRIVFWFDS